MRIVNGQPVRPDGRYVVYWMIAFRRTVSNFALQRAAEAAAEFGRPLVILEPLRTDYPYASDRLHRFILGGMADNARALDGTPVTYLPYVERARGEGQGLLDALAADACLVVTDDFPAFFLPQAIAAAGARLSVRMEAIDSNGIMPVRATPATFSTAHAFRSYIQRTLTEHLPYWPDDIDFNTLPPPVPLSPTIAERWPMARPQELADADRLIRTLPVNHAIGAVDLAGGRRAAEHALSRFVTEALPRYHEDNRQPEVLGTSRLSPYFHFGHISSHQVFSAVMNAERWTTRKLGAGAKGAREGWWGVSAGAEAFLDQFITWREVGFNMCVTRPHDYFTFNSLPAWARATLTAHAADRRAYLYTRDAFEAADTHDVVWNAAQRQLVRDGWMHTYLRMLWGKKILEWSPSPEAALETMIDIMNAHAIDGRDPNSYSGYFWTLGRYDRPWAPERPVYGTVRYMSSENTVKKLRMKGFLKEYGPPGAPLLI